MPPRPRSEAAAVDDITALLTRRGAWWFKTTGVRRVGVPDLVACYRGRFVALEVKRAHRGAGHPVSAAQRVTLEQIRRRAGHTAVATTVDEAAAVLDAIDHLIATTTPEAA